MPRGRRRPENDVEVGIQPLETNGTQPRGSDASDAVYEDPQTQTSLKKQNIPEGDIQLMVKNFVRLALACEYTRTAIKREEISKRVFVNDHKRCFPLIFERTQERLRATFGMEMVEMPAKDRTRGLTMTQQRKAAHSQASAGPQGPAKASKSWILRNILPPEMKQISQRQHRDSDRNYNAVVTIMLVIIVMSDEQCCSENRAISIFERLKWFPTTPVGSFEEVVARMARQGYLERIKDEQSTEGAFNLHVGPRGKLETLQNREELFSVISRIYGHENGEAAQERLERVIQDTLENDDETIDQEDGEEEHEEANGDPDRSRKRSRKNPVEDV